jgi:hypothetical protein
MQHHKYGIGHLVWYTPGKLQPSSKAGGYQVTRLLPAENGEPQYRIRNVAEPFERLASESQLSGRSPPHNDLARQDH